MKKLCKRKCKKIKEFAIEEKESAKLYKKMGFIEQGKDEARHAKYFEKLLKRCK